jgi:RNA polymerase sigma-70 factor (ECF subfamily)
MPTAPPSFEDIWQECVAHPYGGSAWERLWLRLYPAIARIAARVCDRWGANREQEAEDLIQDIWVKITEHALRPCEELKVQKGQVEAYLKVIAANAACDSLRGRFANKRGHRFTRALSEGDQPAADSKGLDELVLLHEVAQLIEGTARERAIFWSYYRHGWTAREIAAMPSVELTAKGVESLIYRMAASLRERF